MNSGDAATINAAIARASRDLDVDLPDCHEQLASPLLGPGRLALGPGVVAGLRHLQGVARPRDRALVAVVGDEAERQLGGLAK